MKLAHLSTIKSERGLRSTLSALFFGAKGALLSSASNFENISRTVSNLRQAGYDDRALAIQESKRFITLELAANTAAKRAASIQTFADTHGVVLEVDFAPDIAHGKDQKQIIAAAEASGVDIELIKLKEQQAIKRKFDQQAQAQHMAEALFWSSEYDEDIEVKTETVLNALVRQRDYMLEWSVLDLGELTILRHDIEALTELLNSEHEDSSNNVDEAPPTPVSMSKMNSEYQSLNRHIEDEEEEDAPISPQGKKGTARRVAKSA